MNKPQNLMHLWQENMYNAIHLGVIFRKAFAGEIEGVKMAENGHSFEVTDREKALAFITGYEKQSNYSKDAA